MAVETYFCYRIDVSILADPLSVGIFEPARPLPIILHAACTNAARILVTIKFLWTWRRPL
jgi:hypothetical protein